MKKTILFSLIAGGLFFASCKKNDEKANVVVPDLSKTSQLANYNTQIIFFLQVDCSPCISGCNCGTTVTVKPSKLASLVSAANGGASAVSSFFSSTAALDIYPGITQAELTKLQSGNYSLLLAASSGNPNLFVFYAGSSSPLTSQNFEFAISTTL